MTSQVVCIHDDVCWDLDVAAERGWRCRSCSAVLGFRPDLDRRATPAKVEAVLDALQGSGLIYVSNASEGRALVARVAQYCTLANVYDQQSIALYLLDEQERRQFWKTQARRWREEPEEDAR
jgi:ABC-type nitrate/sulfonate/bicarbonate transport system substrate-binding protein